MAAARAQQLHLGADADGRLQLAVAKARSAREHDVASVELEEPLALGYADEEVADTWPHRAPVDRAAERGGGTTWAGMMNPIATSSSIEDALALVGRAFGEPPVEEQDTGLDGSASDAGRDGEEARVDPLCIGRLISHASCSC